MTPAVIVLLIVQMSIFSHFGSGPIWHQSVNAMQENCRNYWWSTLLYIQNYYNYDNLVSPRASGNSLGITYLFNNLEIFIKKILVFNTTYFAIQLPKYLGLL